MYQLNLFYQMIIPSPWYLLRCFRDNEKKMFGYRSQVKLCIFKVDLSTALIISILEILNLKKLQDYLEWCWRAVSITTANTYIYTIVHVCLANFMKRVKEHCSKLFKSGMEIIFYSFSLMANAVDMLKVKQVLFDLVIVLSSDRQSELYMKFLHISRNWKNVCQVNINRLHLLLQQHVVILLQMIIVLCQILILKLN